jgi:hypothetical protein
MGLRDHLIGGLTQIHRFTAAETDCSILGRNFKPVSGRRSYEKRPADAGYIANIDAAFDALNEDIEGLILSKTLNQILTFNGEQFIVRSHGRGSVTTIFYCEAKNG